MASAGNRHNLSSAQVKDRILRFCAYQERSHEEVRQKLHNLGSTSDEADELMVFLIHEGFLNEERFARSFARGKFRMKHWGRIRITNNLEARGISKNCIQIGLTEIDPEEYLQTLNKLLTAKAADTRDANIFVRRNKVATFAIRKGFEPDLVWEAVKSLLPDN